MYDVGYALRKLQQHGLALDPTTRLLVTSWVAMQKHCSFCVDIARTAARARLTRRGGNPRMRAR